MEILKMQISSRRQIHITIVVYSNWYHIDENNTSPLELRDSKWDQSLQMRVVLNVILLFTLVSQQPVVIKNSNSALS